MVQNLITLGPASSHTKEKGKVLCGMVAQDNQASTKGEKERHKYGHHPNCLGAMEA
jgi:hypothetical protein